MVSYKMKIVTIRKTQYKNSKKLTSPSESESSSKATVSIDTALNCSLSSLEPIILTSKSGSTSKNTHVRH